MLADIIEMKRNVT